MQLRGFRRVGLEPGQKVTVDFTLTSEDLSLIDVNKDRVVEPGVFDLMVGASSAETSSIALEVVTP
jgi:beta-glucosidase